jgi:hypothetical protein
LKILTSQRGAGFSRKKIVANRCVDKRLAKIAALEKEASMTSKEQKHNNDQAGGKQKSPIPAVDVQTQRESLLDSLVQRAISDPRLLTPKDTLQLQRTSGNQAVSKMLFGMKPQPVIQAKLTVGAANDRYEREADHVAAQVMRLPDQSAPIAQRVGEEDELQAKPLAASITPLIQRAEEDDELQAKSVTAGAAFAPGADFEDRLAMAHGGGAPLPKTTRDFMEARFGADFSGVRLHKGGEASKLNREISAQAFTRGRDIYLGAGKEEVESNAGRQLLAHELTHTIQQGAAAPLQRRTAAGKMNSIQPAKTTSNLLQSKESDKVIQRDAAGLAKGAGKVIAGVTLGPLWDAGKAFNRKRKGGNLFLGGQGYRRYARQDPRKPDEYRTGAQLVGAYGGTVKGGIGRGVGILSTLTGDIAKYAGWATAVLGITMLATAGTTAVVLAPVATILAGITGVALAAKLGLTALNQAYLANRMDTGASDGDLRKEEKHARSDYGRAAISSAAFVGGGLAAESASGSSVDSAWQETTGQSAASSSLPEVAVGASSEIVTEIGDVAHEESSVTFNEEFAAGEKPKKTIGLKKVLHWLNPVYLLIRMLRQIENMSGALLNTFKKQGEHKERKEQTPGSAKALYKVGDSDSGTEGLGHKGIRSIKNFFRSKEDQLNERDEIQTGTQNGYGRTGLKYFSKTLGGVVGGAIGAAGGAVGGAVTGAYQGMSRLGKAGWEKGNELGGVKGALAGGALAFGGGIAGLLGGAIGGSVLGLGKGAAAGAVGGWRAAEGAPRAGQAVGAGIWDKTQGASDKMTETVGKIPVLGKPLAATLGLGAGVIRAGLSLGAGATAAAGQIAVAGIGAGLGAAKATSEAVNANMSGDNLPASLTTADRVQPEAIPAGGYGFMDSLKEFHVRTKNYLKQGEDGLKDVEKKLGTP